MENCWANIDEFLSSGDKKDRQHYKRVLREAQKLGIQMQRHLQVKTQRRLTSDPQCRNEPWSIT